MSLFYYQDQNALSKIYLIQIGDGVTIGKISLTIEATNSILVLVVRRCYHTNGLLLFTKITSVVKRMFCIGRTWTKNKVFFLISEFSKTFRLHVFFSPHQLNSNWATLAHTHLRTVPTIVIAHTVCASPDTQISYRPCLLIQGSFCAV